VSALERVETDRLVLRKPTWRTSRYLRSLRERSQSDSISVMAATQVIDDTCAFIRIQRRRVAEMAGGPLSD